MAIRYLLDTNIASYIIKGHPLQVREWLVRVPMSEVGISAVTEAELRFGAERSAAAKRVKAALAEFLVRAEILPWDSKAAQCYATLRAALEDSGTPMANFDMMIAAQALATGATLISHDRVFQRVRQLKIEDWTKAI